MKVGARFFKLKMNRQLAGIGVFRLSPYSFAPLPFDRFALKQFYLFIILHGKDRPVKHLFEYFVKYLILRKGFPSAAAKY